MIKIMVCLFFICSLFSETDVKKDKAKLKGRKLWLAYDNTLISDLENHLLKIEGGEYDGSKSDRVIKIADEYFNIRSVKDKREITKLMKRLNKITK